MNGRAWPRPLPAAILPSNPMPALQLRTGTHWLRPWRSTRQQLMPGFAVRLPGDTLTVSHTQNRGVAQKSSGRRDSSPIRSHRWTCRRAGWGGSLLRQELHTSEPRGPGLFQKTAHRRRSITAPRRKNKPLWQ
ncbi:hypothetical protein SKAU_G00287210 [Synaphobranchus kaupii]|uniref:Uncharacterized protein n=1 Tax=Synaphobranchus kaupii TaxID=118154 RepID=A0A9Q1IPJ2_SYNKA|nr:hypothetical protein SKAU_G00287210 [Synaphobranchus kaupii]